MTKYIIRRGLQIIPVIIGISILVFLMMHLAPGDPVYMMLGEDATQEDYERIRKHYGFDRPIYIQYFEWAGNALRGDMGRSIRAGAPVTQLVLGRMGATLELAFFSLFVSVGIGIPVGIIAAVKRQSFVDLGSMIGALIGVSMPSFWLGLVLLAYVAIRVDWLPMFGRGPALVDSFLYLVWNFDPTFIWHSIRHLLLPAISLGFIMMGIVTRLTRSSVLETLGEDYIRTARSKGLRERTVILKHALKNALLPVITMVGIQLGFRLGGAVITETVFSWPGVGRLIIDGIHQRDYPIVQAGVLMLAIGFTFINLLVDISYAFIDPRIKYD